jgi:uncharacterized Zn-finger protein
MSNKPSPADKNPRRRTLGYTELEYVCPYCNSRNPGSHRFCSRCGAAQPPDVAFVQPAEEKLITDAERVAALAAKRPDINCPYCEARNAGEAQFCQQCGGDLREGKAREKGGVLGAHRDGPAADVTCPFCSTVNPGTARHCRSCQAPLPGVQTAAPEAPAKKNNRNIILGVVLGILALILLCWFLFFRTSELVGTVQSAEWQRTIPLQALAPVAQEGWRDEIPADRHTVGRCEERPRTTQADPIPGLRSEEICGTPYTIDQGTGFGQVVQDCEYRIYDDWCDYEVLEWTTVSTFEATGNDFAPFWPEPGTIGIEQRFGEYEESYKVVFRADGKNYTWTTSDPERFAEIGRNDNWILNINQIGGVQSLSPAR